MYSGGKSIVVSAGAIAFISSSDVVVEYGEDAVAIRGFHRVVVGCWMRSMGTDGDLDGASRFEKRPRLDRDSCSCTW